MTHTYANRGTNMPTSSFPNASENDKPVVQLDELDTDELRLVASFVELVRNWREDRHASRDVFQALWHRMTARATEDADDDLVMSIALEAQRAVRRAGA